MNKARLATLLREVLKEIEGEPAPAPASALPQPRRRRVHSYKPTGVVSAEAVRDVRRQAAKRGIPL